MKSNILDLRKLVLKAQGLFPIVGLRSLGRRLGFRVLQGEVGGGSEIVQTVIVLGFAIGLGAALMLLQTDLQGAIKTAGTNIIDMFSNAIDGP